MAGILEGIRVLDLTHVLAGPFAGYQLAVMGADVIKIESPSEPDQARYQGSDARLNEEGMGTAFLAQASGKRCVTLDVKTEGGREVLRALVKTADVLIENYRPGALESLGLGYADLAPIRPSLIYCSISAFGSTGPKRELTAYDGVIQAYSGMMAMTGEPGSAPVKCGAPVVDYATGTTACAAVLGALFHRERNGGRGQFIDVAMSEVALILSSSHVTSYLWNGAHPQQKGNRYPFATIGSYEASDGTVMISASNLRQQKRLWEVLGRAELVKQSNAERIRDYGTETAALKEAIATKDVAHWERVLREARVPVSRVQRMQDMLADEQVRSRSVLHRFASEAGELEGLTVPVAAFKYSDAGVSVTQPPQAAGAQNGQVLAEIGYSPDDVAALRRAGAI